MALFEGNVREAPIPLILELISEENILLPLYQRDSVWSEGRVCALWDSLLRGFPLPSFLLTKGSGDSRGFSLGVEKRRATNRDNNDCYYDVLDGQQRLAALLCGFYFKPDEQAVRLWVDLAPPLNKEGQIEKHPRGYKYWVHACTRSFPFGFTTARDGEHDFKPLRDSTMDEIWEALQKTPLGGREIYDLSLSDTFPWHARCPVPLDVVVGNSNLDPRTEARTVKEAVLNAACEIRKNNQGFPREWHSPSESIVDELSRAVTRLRNYTLVLQRIDLESLAKEDDEQGGYTLFERIGRGGVQVSQRQLAVSRLMLALGRDGNDAIAAFRTSRWGTMLETEEVLGALARVAYVCRSSSRSEKVGTSETSQELPDSWDRLSNLSPEGIHSLKRNEPDDWRDFIGLLSEYCRPGDGGSRLAKAFNRLFQDLLLFDTDSNPYGLPLVQLALAGRSGGEGPSAVTLHPLLLCCLRHTTENPVTQSEREEAIKWILFANGICKEPGNEVLNREAFRSAFQVGRIEVGPIVRFAFEKTDLAEELGLTWEEPSLQEGQLVRTKRTDRELPDPKAISELMLKRLLLLNSADSMVNRFLLMWNQRMALHALYGDVPVDRYFVLTGKGRPYDADHVVARSRLLHIGIDKEEFLLATRNLMKEESITAPALDHWVFRLRLPYVWSNYRYWPRRLNRSDGPLGVAEKMQTNRIRDVLKGSPLLAKFGNATEATPWSWSAIAEEDRQLWAQLPPNDNRWTAETIETYLRAMSNREAQLYGAARRFVCGAEGAVEGK